MRILALTIRCAATCSAAAFQPKWRSFSIVTKLQPREVSSLAAADSNTQVSAVPGVGPYPGFPDRSVIERQVTNKLKDQAVKAEEDKVAAERIMYRFTSKFIQHCADTGAVAFGMRNYHGVQVCLKSEFPVEKVFRVGVEDLVFAKRELQRITANQEDSAWINSKIAILEALTGYEEAVSDIAVMRRVLDCDEWTAHLAAALKQAGYTVGSSPNWPVLVRLVPEDAFQSHALPSLFVDIDDDEDKFPPLDQDGDLVWEN